MGKPLTADEIIQAAADRGYMAWPSPHGSHPYGTDIWLVEMIQLIELRLAALERADETK
mgnify:CR=1 FL=1